AVAYPRMTPATSDAVGIDPAHPPLPACSYLPFQPETGIHTSNVISESLEGFVTALTTQRAGTTIGAGPPARPPPTGPSGTTAADMIEVCGSASDTRLSHAP